MTRVDLSELHKNILNDMLARLKNLLRAESASLFLFDSEREELVLNSVFDEHKTRFRGLRQPLGEGVAGSVATKRQAVLVKDIKTDPRFPQGQHFRHYHTDSFICVPVLTYDRLIGVINISDKVSREAFSEKDFELACLIAQMTSHVVENEFNIARLREENDALRREKTEALRERAFLEKFASVGKLAGGIVHEINNPLDAVMRYTNLLIERELDPSVAREFLNEVKVGLTRITKITRSLLEFSQQLNDNRRQEVGDVHEMIEEALSLFRHTLFQEHIQVEKTFAAHLPPVIDKGLCRVFSNIIKNAFDAMPGGGTLRIFTHRDDESLTVTFADSGEGIPEDVQEKIFTPFFTTKPIGQGVGLGLPICFEVVKRYEGKIDIESRPGEGTLVRLRLPLKNLLPSADK
jgi:signal transduction histidine kinase